MRPPVTCDPFTEFHSVPENSQLALSRPKSVTVAGSQQQAENAGSLLELEPGPFQREGSPTFPRTSFCSFRRGCPSILCPASGAIARRAARPPPPPAALGTTPPAGRAGLGRAGGGRRTHPPREGRGDQRRPRGQSPQSRSSRRCAGSGQSPRGPSQVSNTVLRVRGAPRAGCDPPRSTPAAPHPRPSVIYSERGDMRGARGLETMPSLFRCPGQLHALIMQGSPYPVLVL